MTMSPSEKYQKAEALKGRAREARKLLDEIRTAAQESKDGENAVTAGRRLEQIHGWAGEARDHLALPVPHISCWTCHECEVIRIRHAVRRRKPWQRAGYSRAT